jgi:hypothetical protein
MKLGNNLNRGRKMTMVKRTKALLLFVACICIFVTADVFGTTVGNIVISSSGSEIIGGLHFRDGDLVEYNPVTNTSSLLFSATLFLRDEDIDAVSMLANGNIVFSTEEEETLFGFTFRDGDLIEYNPVTNMVSLFFSEDLLSNGADIDAACVLDNGNIVLSSQSPTKLGGLRFNDGDLVEYNPTTDFARLLFSEGYFSEDEDIDAVSILENGNILLSTKTPGQLGGLRFRYNDLVEFDPSTGMASIYLSGGNFSFGDKSLDAVHVAVIPEPATIFLLGFGGFLLKRRKS